MGLLNLSYIYQEFPTRYLEGTVSLPASAARMVHVGYGYVLEHISHSRGLQFVI